MEELIKQIKLLREAITASTDKIDHFYTALGDKLNELTALYTKQVVTTDALVSSLNESEANNEDLAQVVNTLQTFVDTVTSE
jgi:phosphate uptake regulator